jgi:hypothetical protein
MSVFCGILLSGHCGNWWTQVSVFCGTNLSGNSGNYLQGNGTVYSILILLHIDQTARRHIPNDSYLQANIQFINAFVKYN